MNIFKKYKSNTIAVLVSLFFYGILFVLLNIIPNQDSLSKEDPDPLTQDISLQFQPEEEAQMPAPAPTQTPNENKSTEQSTDNPQPKELTPTTDEIKNFEQGDNETNVVENQDSVILVQLKKSLAVLKEIIPDDSLEKKQIQQENTKKVQKALTEKTQLTADDWQFIRNNYKTIQNIRRIYPYALKTKEIVDKLNSQLATMTDKQEKRRLIKNTEKELFQQFEKDVRKMSYSQGKLLLKLLSRETDQTAYGLIKTYKGGIPATFWYGVGLLFHEDLKARYDSVGEDAVLEQIIKKYKLGKL